MPNAPKSGSLLDSLRAQSTAVRAQGEAARKPVEEALADIDRLLWRAFRWLDEALGHLEVIKPSPFPTWSRSSARSSSAAS